LLPQKRKEKKLINIKIFTIINIKAFLPTAIYAKLREVIQKRLPEKTGSLCIKKLLRNL
jgi:hypothetical protein